MDAPAEAKPALDMLREVGGDDMVGMMMETFLQFADDRMDQVLRDSEAGRLPEIAGIAHSLKSSARQLGALTLGDACAEAETAAKAGDRPLALSGVEAMRQEYASAKPWMQALVTGAS